MTVQEFYNALEALYPRSLSCPWDNDGIMCCADLSSPVRRVLVALDATAAVLARAAEEGFDLVLTHHPMVFRGPKSLTCETPTGARLISALTAGVCVISLHTRLDAGEGGVNDCLAEALALAGPYTSFGDDEAPTLGRIGTTDISDGSAFAAHVKERLCAPAAQAYLCRPVHRVAVCGGSGGDLVLPALLHGADTLVTGECGYNDAIDALDGETGLNVIVAGHFHTEHPVCARLASLAREIAGAETQIMISDPAITF